MTSLKVEYFGPVSRTEYLLKKEQDDILGEYLSECSEMLERLCSNLENLEKEHFDRSILRGFARDIHTVKGSSQLFGFQKIGKLSHAVEECLERVQETPRESLHGLAELLFEALDQISKIFSVVQSSRVEPAQTSEYDSIISRLEEFNGGRWIENSERREFIVNPSMPTHDVSPQSDNFSKDQSLTSSHSVSLVEDVVDNESISDVHIQGEKYQATVKSGLKVSDDLHADSIRVNVDLLDGLMGQVSELLLLRNELNQIAKDHGSDELLGIQQRLSSITGELQNNVMKTRMQPFGNLLGKFQRVVRDISRDLGKSASLTLEGADTDLDKSLLESIRDPLTHIIRNAIDHGIENSAERVKKGKHAQGIIRLRATHENGYITIEVQDDGRGIDLDRLRIKASEKSLLTPELLSKLTDQETLQLIFLPGFSTAERVSNVSGRGMGMDIVKTNVERIGGVVQVQSKPLEGTRVVLKIPLTLAIISALLVKCKGYSYAIPQIKILEILRVDRRDIGSMQPVDQIVDSLVIRLRGKLLPLISLKNVLGLEEIGDGFSDEVFNVIVIHSDQQFYGLIVDSVVDSSDIVVKPLFAVVKGLGVYSGASILADGSTALILDINGIANKYRFFDPKSLAVNYDQPDDSKIDFVKNSEIIEYLLFDIGLKSQCAIPLCLIYRLEEFGAKNVQFSGDKRVIKYRNEVLPILSLRECLGYEAGFNSSPSKEEIIIIVMRRGDRFIGFEVESIVDIFLTNQEIVRDTKNRDSVLGTFVQDGNVLLVIDAQAILSKAVSIQNDFLVEQSSDNNTGYVSGRERHHILLVEDGNFLRKQVARILENSGYRVTTEIDGLRAFELLETSRSDPFTLLLSDIEMPVMDGFELIKKIRGQSRTKNIPAVALTSRYSKADIKKGLELGFNRYIDKMNSSHLVHEIDQVLGL